MSVGKTFALFTKKKNIKKHVCDRIFIFMLFEFNICSRIVLFNKNRVRSFFNHKQFLLLLHNNTITHGKTSSPLAVATVNFVKILFPSSFSMKNDCNVKVSIIILFSRLHWRFYGDLVNSFSSWMRLGSNERLCLAENHTHVNR